MDRNRRRIGGGIALSLLAGILTLIPASMAGAAAAPQPTLTPPNGQTAVKPGDEVQFGGTVEDGATLVRSFLRVHASNGSVVQDDIDASDGTFLEGGSISGSWILPYLEPNAATIRFHVVADSGGTESSGVSAAVPVDQVRPAILGAELVSPSQIRVRFTEPVSTPPSRDQVLDWQVDGLPPTSVEGGGAQRILNIAPPKDRDATPVVDYLPRAPISESYRDSAHNNLSGDNRPARARDLTPPLPPTVEQVAGRAPDGGRVTRNDTTPDVRLTGIKEGDVGQVYRETNDQPGFQVGGDEFLGEQVADASGAVTITTPDLGPDGDHLLYGVAHDRALCNPPDGSQECPNHSDGSAVTYDLDTIAPLPLFAVTRGTELDVRFTEPVFPGGGDASDWTVTAGGPITGVAQDGDRRMLSAASTVPATATLAYDRNPPGHAYEDEAGNALASFGGLDLLDAIPPVLDVTQPASEVHVNANTLTIQGTAEAAQVVKAYRDTNGDGDLDAGEPFTGDQASVSSQAAGTPFSITVSLDQNAQNHFVLQGEKTSGGQTFVGPAEDVPTIVEDSTPPSVSLEEPDGGEILRGNQPFTIEWDASDAGPGQLDGSPIRIDYSPNGGGSWTTIADRIADSGEYDWTTPSASTEQARIRVFARDVAGNMGGPSASGNFVIDAINPFFVARTVNATRIDVRFSERVAGLVSRFEWWVDGQLVSDVSPSGPQTNVTRLILTPSQQIGSRARPTIEYKPLLATTLAGNELDDRAANPIFPKMAVAADGIFCDYVYPQHVNSQGVMEGTEQADVFCTHNGNVTVNARGGDDVVVSTGGAKVVYGGFGNDRIQGGPGNDQLFGGPGNDVVDAGSGADAIDLGLGSNRADAGPGDDRVAAGPGFDHVVGGEGNDRINVGEGDDFVDAGAGHDLAFGGPGRDALIGGAGKDVLRGFTQHDVLRGGRGKDLLAGDGGKDRLLGQGGKDRLRGGGGKDRMNGGPGKDKCQGGGGRDSARRCERGKA